MRRGKGLLEIGHGLARALMQAGFDLVGEHGAGPAVLDGLPGVPEAQERAFDFLQEPDVVSPGDFCHSLWQIRAVQFCHKLWQNPGVQAGRRFPAVLDAIGPCEIKGAHPPDVARRKTLHGRKRAVQIPDQPLHHGVSITALLLGFDDGLAEVPIERDQFPVNREGRPKLGGLDPGLQAREERTVIGGQGWSRRTAGF